MSKVIVEYDGAFAKIKNLDKEHHHKISNVLTYYDSNVAFQAKRTKNPHITPYKKLYNLKEHKFLTGLLVKVNQVLSLLEVDFEIVKTHEKVVPTPWELPEWAYSHQRRIVHTALGMKRCMIQSPTGSGKTFAAAFFLAHFPRSKCLFVVPTKMLLSQTAQVLAEILDEPIGQIGDGKRKWERITVGIVNSLSKAAERGDEELRTMEVIIFDEAHKIGNSYYSKVCKFCVNSDYRIALSATPKTDNNIEMIVEGHAGPLALRIKTEELTDLGVIFKPEYYVVEFYHNSKAIYPKAKRHPATGTVIRNSWNDVVYDTVDEKPFIVDVMKQSIAGNVERNKLIIEILGMFLESKTRTGTALILVELKEHAANLIALGKEMLGLDIPFCSGSNTAKQVDQMVDRLSSGEDEVMISTRVLNEGRDIKPIELVIIANGGRSGSRVIQQTGRVVRQSKETNKTRAIVIDFPDFDAAFFLTSQAEKRVAEINNEYPGCTRHVNLKELKNLLG